MPDNSDVSKAIADLVEQLTRESAGSIDYAANAKAIALSAASVTEKLAALLSAGRQLVDIVPLTGFGSSVNDFRLRFHFRSSNPIDLPVDDFVVSVNLATKVAQIVDVSTASTPPSVAAPFSLAIPSRARDFRTPVREMGPRFRRARSFFGSRAVRAFENTYNTSWDSPTNTYGNTHEWTSADSVYDTNGVTDTVIDNTIDGSLDPETDVGLDEKHDDV